MPDEPVDVIVGVDTHTDTHTAVAIDLQGRRLDELEIAADPGGYRRLLEWAHALGTIHAVGVEGTGSYGAGLTRFLDRRGCDGDRGRAAEPSTPPPLRQVRPRRRRGRRPGGAVRRSHRVCRSPATGSSSRSARCTW